MLYRFCREIWIVCEFECSLKYKNNLTVFICRTFVGPGTYLRYFQSLLGHGSSKTTKVYTHITTSGFGRINSPLVSLEL